MLLASSTTSMSSSSSAESTSSIWSGPTSSPGSASCTSSYVRNPLLLPRLMSCSFALLPLAFELSAAASLATLAGAAPALALEAGAPFLESLTTGFFGERSGFFDATATSSADRACHTHDRVVVNLSQQVHLPLDVTLFL